VFTGLIQSSGSLYALGQRQLLVRCQSRDFVDALGIGDSVAVDGACLTVETIEDNGFVVTVSPETLRRTTFEKTIDTEWVVNLEPALRVGDRLGGHFVSGHIDGLGQLKAFEQSAESWQMHFTVLPELGRYILPKGSIAINGVSLTIADCTEDGTQFMIAVIPHSFANTNFQYLVLNQAVNIETDMLGKYVAKLLQYPSHRLEPDITPHFLAEHGFV
jgi:riboflavin synthase